MTGPNIVYGTDLVHFGLPLLKVRRDHLPLSLTPRFVMCSASGVQMLISFPLNLCTSSASYTCKPCCCATARLSHYSSSNCVQGFGLGSLRTITYRLHLESWLALQQGLICDIRSLSSSNSLHQLLLQVLLCNGSFSNHTHACHSHHCSFHVLRALAFRFDASMFLC